jgi:hypothetical protein
LLASVEEKGWAQRIEGRRDAAAPDYCFSTTTRPAAFM